MALAPSYKTSEVGLIPDDWDVKHLGDLGDVVRGGSPRPAGDPRYFGGDFVPWLTVASLTGVPESQLYVAHTQSALTELGSRYSRTLPSGVLAIVNSGAKTLGVAKILSMTCCANDGIAAIINQSCGDTRFLAYYLNSQTKRLREVVAAGNDQLNLNTKRIALIAVPFPEESEQSAIADALEDVDALIEASQRLILKKRDVCSATAQQLLSGRARLPGYSDAWEVKPLGEIASVRAARIDPRQSGEQAFCVELEHIEPGTGRLLGSTSAGAQASLKAEFKAGDVLFGKLRAYLRKFWLATTPGVCSTEIWSLCPNLDVTTSEYLLQIVKSDAFIEAASVAYGTHMPRSDWNTVKSVRVPLPSVPEQKEIAAILTTLDEELATLERRTAKLITVKLGMTQQLLTGKTRLSAPELVNA